MPSKLPSYAQDKLALVGGMTSQIAAAADRYGVPAEAIAGALAQELSDQTDSLTNYGKMVGSSAFAHLFLDGMFLEGVATNPFHPAQGASDRILDWYNADPNATTVGQDLEKKVRNSSNVASVPFIPPDASFPLSPQSEVERRFGSWLSPTGGVLSGFNQAPQGSSDTPNDEDWSAMWRRRTGLP